MANKNLFKNIGGMVVNEAGGLAHKLSPVHALSQYAATGCLSNTFYADAEMQLGNVLDMCRKVEPEMVAKIAVFSRERGYMKDMPALLVAYLADAKQNDLLAKVFSRVIDNGKMLRNFIQIIRSGAVGRKSFGSLPKKLIANWFNSRTTKEIFSQSVGNDPSFLDILRLAHPKPLDQSKNALYRWFLGKEYEWNDLPPIVQEFENFKSGKTKEVPHVPFEMLTALKMGQSEWSQVALRAGWHWLRMNLNTMQRHQVFDIPEMVEMVVNRLTDRESILKARVFPYQILAAFKNVSDDIPGVIREALQNALEVATENVPEMHGDGYVLVDISGSMASSITGYRVGATSKVRCVDVAGLIASSLLRKNPASAIVPFNTGVRAIEINPRDSVLTNADKLGKMVGGGTSCSAPLAMLNERGARGSWVFLISDNQSWADTMNKAPQGGYWRETPFMTEWLKFKARNQQAKLVCLDIQPYGSTQAQERTDILNIGGWSDSCFEVASTFIRGELHPEHWMGVINKIEL